MEKKGLLARIRAWYAKSMIGEFLNSYELNESDDGIIDSKSYKDVSKKTIDTLNETIMNVTPEEYNVTPKEYKVKPSKRLDVEKVDNICTPQDVEYTPQGKTEKAKSRATGKAIGEN